MIDKEKRMKESAELKKMLEDLGYYRLHLRRVDSAFSEVRKDVIALLDSAITDEELEQALNKRISRVGKFVKTPTNNAAFDFYIMTLNNIKEK
jgi:siroheme synthase (precorrin-2 oxidase/ferrochelatase)